LFLRRDLTKAISVDRVQLIAQLHNLSYGTSLAFPISKTRGVMRKTIKLLFLELLGAIFGLAWAGAAIASVYFLYGATANSAPWSYVLWSFGVGLFAMLIVASLRGCKQRVDYVDQLIERGYSKGEAAEAWHTADSGGLNLLRNLQQVELSKEIGRLKTAISTPNGEGDST